MNLPDNINCWNLYVITDENLSGGRSHLEIAEQAIAGGADVIQLRDKTASSRKLFDIGTKLRELTSKHQVNFIVNDRVDVALAIQADGVHVGQSDLPASTVRQLIGSQKILGVSAGSLHEAIQAQKDGADYLGVGPIFEARSTKADAGDPIGLKLIQDIRKQCKLPIVAIGGIDQENVKEVIQTGADCAAIISAIVSAENIKKITTQIKTIIQSIKAEI
jgi:thiamine-phosphate pyrophosphorylase